MAPTEKWGTINACRFPLGHQRMTNFEIQQSVERLTMHRPKKFRPWWEGEWKHKKVSSDKVGGIVARLTKNSDVNVTDSRRTSQGRILRMGVVNSYAWKGYN